MQSKHMRTPFSITSRVLCCRVMILSTVRLLVRPSPIWKSPNHLGCSVFSTTAALSRWKQPPKNITEERLAGRREFEAFKTSSATNDDDDDIHLNPLSHQERLYAPQNPSSQENKQSIRVCVLGVPNAGKSTLVNQLVHANVCAHSHKTHTTRKSSRAILTKEDVQVVFSDTPGIVKPGDIKKFKLEDSLIQQPVESVKEADLILVVQDVSNRFTREAIDKGILKLLCYHSAATGIPSVLVLNKLDVCPKKRSVYELIQKLTCGYLDGVKQKTRKASENRVLSNAGLDSYLKRKLKAAKELETDKGSIGAEHRVSSYEDFVRILKTELLTDSLVSHLTNSLAGWPGFKEVFAVSALEGNGVDDLRDYIIHSAQEAPWDFHPDLKTDLNPKDLVLSIVKSKCLEVLPGEVPYRIVPEIASWKVDNGVLRLNIQLTSSKPRVTSLLLYHKASNLSLIAKLCEHDLQNFFGREVFVLISVNVTHSPKPLPTYKETSKDQHVDVFL